jgi:hypothetical protein
VAEPIKRNSQFTWSGLTLQHRTVMSGAQLEPKWALVRVRRVLEQDDATAMEQRSDGDLRFEGSLTRIALTAAFLPYRISGDVRAESIPGGLVVTASTSVGTLVAGLALSLVGITLIFDLNLLWPSGIYWVWLGIAAVVTGVHLWQAANVLRRLTTAATTL